MFYSAQTGGFYDRSIHGENIPTDAVEITAEQHAALIEGQSHGKQIVADENGFPVLQDPPAPSVAEKKAAVQSQIDAIESKTIMNRATREFMLRLAEKEAEGQGVTLEQLYAANDGYKAVKDVDSQVAALRAQMKGIK